MNLLLHACKWSPDGGEVRVTAREEKEFAEVDVSFDGMEIGEDALGRLFERFAPLELPRRPDLRSTGLELYKARRLVELHGGSIAAASEPGRGTTFTFTIPVARNGE